MFRTVPVLIASVLVAVSGLAHGLWTARWQQSDELATALTRLPHVPRAVGDWRGRDLEVDEALFRQARAEGYWARRYEKPGGDDAFSVILMCGRAGPMAVHTPDVCYRGAGYELAGPAERLTVDVPGAEPAQLWTARFRKESPTDGGELRLYWGWTADGAWEAPDWPRWTFGGRPLLFKLYIIRETTDSATSAPDDTARTFLGRLLPALNRALLTPSGS
jgi:hypothetical protein